jgi:cold shock CspA family protein
MEVPLVIAFRDVERSAEIDADIRDHAAKLDEFYSRITSCKVVVEAPHRSHREGNLYHVRVIISVPGREIVVDREPPKHHAHEDLHVTIRDAFKDVRRQLQDFARELRGDVKHHESPPHGRVVKLVPDEDWGMIETPDGREVYFHANSLIEGSFKELAVGTELRFVEEEGEKGPQATSVRVVGWHHHFAG